MLELDICKICGAKVEKLNHFWKLHGLSLEDYCLSKFNRRDLLDNSVIPFKSPEQYFSVSFSNKNNLKAYLKRLPKSESVDFCKDMLAQRVKLKELKYSPFQVELRSLPCFPPVSHFLSTFDYYGFCEGMGLINRTRPIDGFSLPLNTNIGTDMIIVDSRESAPIKFDIGYKVQKLDFGDYHFTGNPNLYFERKSLPDFIGTLTQGYDRFKKELERSQAAGAYLVVIVENTLSQALSFNHLPWMRRVKTKASPEFVFHRMRELLQIYPNLQFFFCDGRAQVQEYMIKGFLSGTTFQDYDVQLLCDLDLF